MAKTQKELAFLRDLYIQDEWTRRFTDLVDKHMDLRDSENMLYINAGTGGHALAINERFGEKTDIFAQLRERRYAWRSPATKGPRSVVDRRFFDYPV